MFCYVTSLITVKSSWSAALTIIVSQADLSTHCVLMMSVCFVSFWYFTSLLSRLVFFVFFSSVTLSCIYTKSLFLYHISSCNLLLSPGGRIQECSTSHCRRNGIDFYTVLAQLENLSRISHTHTRTCHARAHTVKEMINQATFFNAEQIQFDNVALIPVHSSKISHTLIRGFYKPYFSDYPTLFVLEPSAMFLLFHLLTGPAPNGWSTGPH